MQDMFKADHLPNLFTNTNSYKPFYQVGVVLLENRSEAVCLFAIAVREDMYLSTPLTGTIIKLLMLYSFRGNQ